MCTVLVGHLTVGIIQSCDKRMEALIGNNVWNASFGMRLFGAPLEDFQLPCLVKILKTRL